MNCTQNLGHKIGLTKEEKGKYINLLSSENVKELTKWGLELQEKENERIKKFSNKEVGINIPKKIIEKDSNER